MASMKSCYLGLCLLSSFASTQVLAAMSWQSIATLVQTQDIRTMEGLLERLPAKDLQQYLVIYGSDSPQVGNLQEPRILSFGNDAKLLLAFTGNHTRSEPFRTLDVLEFNEANARYEAHSIVFALDGQAAASVNPNPTACAQCHLSQNGGLQPIRGKYLGGIYPGIYGSLDDAFTEPEYKAFKTFMQNAPDGERYKFLPELQGSSTHPWPEIKPNKILGYLVNKNLFRGWSQEMQKTEVLKPFRYALLAATECAKSDPKQTTEWDSDLSHYVPETLRATFKTTWADVVEESFRNQTAVFENKMAARGLWLHEDLDAGAFKGLEPKGEQYSAALLYFYRNIAGIDTMAFRTMEDLVREGTDGYGGVRNLSRELYKTLLTETDGELWTLHQNYDAKHAGYFQTFAISDESGAKICAALQTKSLNALATVTMTQTAAKKPTKLHSKF